MDKSIIIAGTSPFAFKVKGKIPAISQKIPILGLNHFPAKIFKNTDYWFLLDSFNPEFYPYIDKQKIVTQAFTCKGDYPFYKKYITCETFVTKENGFLGGYLNVAIFAINFAYLEGFRNIYLLGVDFISENWRDEEYCRLCREYIEELNTIDDLKIFTLNPDSEIKIPYKDIEKELNKWH